MRFGGELHQKSINKTNTIHQKFPIDWRHCACLWHDSMFPKSRLSSFRSLSPSLALHIRDTVEGITERIEPWRDWAGKRDRNECTCVSPFLLALLLFVMKSESDLLVLAFCRIRKKRIHAAKRFREFLQRARQDEGGFFDSSWAQIASSLYRTKGYD